jgi:hypothetical protein
MSLTLRSTNRSIGRNEAMRAAAASGFTAVIGTGFLIAAPFTQALAQPPEPQKRGRRFRLEDRSRRDQRRKFRCPAREDSLGRDACALQGYVG